MDWMTIGGIGGSFLLIVLGILINGAGVGGYISPSSLLIVFGGSFCSMAAMHFRENLVNFIKIMMFSFKKQEFNYSQTVITMISFSEKARREGLLSLEDDIGDVEDNFIRVAIQLVIDGAEPEVVRQVLLGEVNSLERRHEEGRKMFSDLATLSPTYGLIGTLIGLVIMLSSLGSGNVELIGSGMAAALLTTFYGAILAYGVWGPIAAKLEKNTSEEIFIKEIILEGILSLQFGDNPKMLQQKLLSYFPMNVKKEIEAEANA